MSDELKNSDEHNGMSISARVEVTCSSLNIGKEYTVVDETEEFYVAKDSEGKHSAIKKEDSKVLTIIGWVR